MAQHNTPPKSGVFAKAEARTAERGAATARIVVVTITGFIIGAIWLAAATTVPELVRATGELVPTGHAQQVQTPEQGIVASVLVEEGQTVEEGQVLTVLTSTELDQTLDDVLQELFTLRTRHENLQAIMHVAARDPASEQTGPKSGPGGTDMSYATTQWEVFSAQQNVQLALLRHHKKTRATLQSARDLTIERVQSRKERVARAEALFKNGLTPRRDLDNQQDGLDQLQANLIEIDIRLAQAGKDLASVQATLEQNQIALLETTSKEAFDLEDRIAKLKFQAEALASRRESLRVRAPEAGVIHAVGYPNQGEVIAAGTTLFELLPIGPQLVAQLQIDPVDIGHIKRGDAVALKFDTFDARRYGQVSGNITSISPNSVIDEMTGMGYFRATVTLEQGSIGQGAWQRELHAGMGASAEIVTDERTVLAYLMKPINRSLTNAFGER